MVSQSINKNIFLRILPSPQHLSHGSAESVAHTRSCCIGRGVVSGCQRCHTGAAPTNTTASTSAATQQKRTIWQSTSWQRHKLEYDTQQWHYNWCHFSPLSSLRIFPPSRPEMQAMFFVPSQPNHQAPLLRAFWHVLRAFRGVRRVSSEAGAVTPGGRP